MEKFVIPDIVEPEKDYLVRWRLVQTPWFGIFIHKILMIDNDVNTHDHPWDFIAIILKGGYRERWFERLEHKLAARRWWGVGSIHRMKTTEFHAIKELFKIPTWTLVFTGPRKQEWGYRVGRDNGGVSEPIGRISRKDYDWHKYNYENTHS